MKILGIFLALGVVSTVQAATTDVSTTAHDEVITQFPVEQAITNIYTKKADRKMYARYEGRNLQLRSIITPLGQVEFDGQQVMGAQITEIHAANGKTFGESAGINYFTLEPLTFYGFTDDDGSYSIATQHAIIPKLARIGDSSTFVTENVYSDSSKRKQIERYTQTWSLSQASSDTAWLRIETSENLLDHEEPDALLNEYYRINNEGEILSSGFKGSYVDGDNLITIAYKGRCIQPERCKPQVNK